MSKESKEPKETKEPDTKDKLQESSQDQGGDAPSLKRKQTLADRVLKRVGTPLNIVRKQTLGVESEVETFKASDENLRLWESLKDSLYTGNYYTFEEKINEVKNQLAKNLPPMMNKDKKNEKVAAQLKALLNYSHPDGSSILTVVASLDLDPDVVETLVSLGADLNKETVKNRVPLVEALSIGNVDRTKDFLNNGADVNKAGNDVSGKTVSPLIAALTMTNIDKESVAIILSKNVNLNYQDSDGETALMYAIEASEVEIAAKIIEKGADLNLQNKRGQTALMKAVEKKQWDLVRQLLDRGADPDKRNYEDKRAFDLRSDIPSDLRKPKIPPKPQVLIDKVRRKIHPSTSRKAEPVKPELPKRLPKPSPLKSQPEELSIEVALVQLVKLATEVNKIRKHELRAKIPDILTQLKNLPEYKNYLENKGHSLQNSSEQVSAFKAIEKLDQLEQKAQEAKKSEKVPLVWKRYCKWEVRRQLERMGKDPLRSSLSNLLKQELSAKIEEKQKK